MVQVLLTERHSNHKLVCRVFLSLLTCFLFFTYCLSVHLSDCLSVGLYIYVFVVCCFFCVLLVFVAYEPLMDQLQLSQPDTSSCCTVLPHILLHAGIH